MLQEKVRLGEILAANSSWCWGTGLKSQGTWQCPSPCSPWEQADRREWTAEEFQSAWEHTWPQLSAQRKKSQRSNSAFKNLCQLAKDKLFLECFLQWGPHFSVRMGGSKPKGNSFKSRGEGNWGRESNFNRAGSWLNARRNMLAL